MKPKSNPFLRNLLTAATLGLGSAASAQSVIDWSATAGTTAWATNGNWAGGTAPTSDLTTHIARFNQTSYNFQPSYGTTSIAGIIVGDGTTATAPLTLSGTTLRIGASGTDFKVQTSTDLITWTDAASDINPAIPGTVFISGSNYIYTMPTGTSKTFVRLNVTQ